MGNQFTKEDAPEVSLEDILKNDIVLLDCSMKGDEDDFYWQLGEVKRSSQLDIEAITQEEIRVGIFQNRYLHHPQIMVSEKLADEFGRLAHIVGKKIKYLFEMHPDTRSNMKYRANTEKKALQNLQGVLYNMSRRINRSKVSVEDFGINIKNHQYFLDMIKIINKEIGLKKDSNPLFGKHTSKKYEDSDTDEDTLALGYCIALSESSCGILTQDTDYIRLAGVCTRLIGSEDFFEYNQDFRRVMRNNGPKIYFKDRAKNKITVPINTENILFSPEFKINNISLERNIEVKHQIKDIWKEIYRSL